jgi:hypothetical protein
VTLGDSWTWGDELSDRLHTCWGNILSEKIGSDWLNLSVPGAGNHYIGQLYQDFVNYIKQNNNYEDILCIIVMTETGRDFNGWFDRDVDYASWLRDNIKDHNDYYRFLEFINDFAIDRILSNRIDGVELLIGFNFVSASSVIKLQHLLLEKTWIEVYTKQDLTDCCYIVSPYIFEKLDSIFSMEWSLDRGVFREWQVKQLEATEKRLSILNNRRFFYPRLHPNESGHVAWAEYLYEKMKKNGSKIIK